MNFRRSQLSLCSQWALNIAAGTLLFLSLHPVSVKAASGALSPGFQFRYDKPNQPLAIPVTGQCERIHLTWARTTNTTGPFPVAPYSLQVYSSAFSAPFIVSAGFGPAFDWDVPFPPNTQYQICMFDVNGVSGGCQQMYTMISNTTTTTSGSNTITSVVPNPTCQNATGPNSLAVTGTVPLGQLSTFSYIDQCTTLSVTPQGGSPPYTLTIAPDYHPPFNVTSNSREAISWDVALPVGFRFFMSLTSSDGSMWSAGPLRVGPNGPTDCLATGVMSKSMVTKIVAGTGVGGALLGALLAALGYYAFIRIRDARRPPSREFRGYHDEAARPLKSTAPSVIGGASVARTYATDTLSSMPLASTVPMSLQPNRPHPAGNEYSELQSEPATPPPPPRSLRPVRNRSTTNMSTTSEATTGYTAPAAPSSEFSHVSTPSSAQTLTTTMTTSSSTTSTPSTTTYPPDVKYNPGRRFIPTNNNGLFSDTASLASTASYSATAQAPRNMRDPARLADHPHRLSVVSKAPTYAPNPPAMGMGHHQVYVIQEIEGSGGGATGGGSPELPPEYGRHVQDPALPPPRELDDEPVPPVVPPVSAAHPVPPLPTRSHMRNGNGSGGSGASPASLRSGYGSPSSRSRPQPQPPQQPLYGGGSATSTPTRTPRPLPDLGGSPSPGKF